MKLQNQDLRLVTIIWVYLSRSFSYDNERVAKQTNKETNKIKE